MKIDIYNCSLIIRLSNAYLIIVLKGKILWWTCSLWIWLPITEQPNKNVIRHYVSISLEFSRIKSFLNSILYIYILYNIIRLTLSNKYFFILIFLPVFDVYLGNFLILCPSTKIFWYDMIIHNIILVVFLCGCGHVISNFFHQLSILIFFVKLHVV